VPSPESIRLLDSEACLLMEKTAEDLLYVVFAISLLPTGRRVSLTSAIRIEKEAWFIDAKRHI
jgi:hypothetical protein